MKTASELRKTLDEALKPDSSGKTTPMQRLTPFLRLLVEHLEENETAVLSLINAGAAIEARTNKFLGADYASEADRTVRGHYEGSNFVVDYDSKVSSDAPTQAVPASPTNEPGSASKASA